MSFSTVLNALSHRILSFDNCSHYLTTPVPRIITHRITDTVDLVSFVYLQFVKNKCVVPWFLFELQKCFTLSFVLHTLTFFTNILLLEFNNPAVTGYRSPIFCKFGNQIHYYEKDILLCFFNFY